MSNLIVCLTPVKNEEWVIAPFLQAVSLWADHIIVADQNSSDNSGKIIGKFPKVKLVNNPDRDLNEVFRQQLLLNEARKLPNPKTLIALDADEFLTPNFASHEWQTLKTARPGTIFYFQMLNLLPGLKRCWSFPQHFLLALVDDGSPHQGQVIHGPRLPLPKKASKVFLQQIKVMHLQYLDPKRNESKQRWYQCWETINHPTRHPLDIYRQYHHHLTQKGRSILKTPKWWLNNYFSYSINLRSIKSSAPYWWDQQVNQFYQRYGPTRFRYLAVNIQGKGNDCGQSFRERLFLSYLRQTQPFYPRYCLPRLDNLLKRLIKPEKTC